MKHKVADKIRKARVIKGLSQQNMADELDITVAAYSNIERGVTDISVTRLVQISGILGVHPHSFIVLDETEASIFNEKINPVENYGSNVANQLYSLMQQFQQLQLNLERIETELEELKGSKKRVKVSAKYNRSKE